jgi:hypothetical protein
MARSLHIRALIALWLSFIIEPGCGRTLPFPADQETVLAIRVLPEHPVLYLNEEVQLTVEATILKRVEETWKQEVQDVTQEENLLFGVNDAGVIEIREDTTLFGNAAGSARLTASFQGRQEVTDIVVAAAGLSGLTIGPPDQTLPVGGLLQLVVVGELTDGDRLYLTDPATGTTYESSDPAVAQVSAGGQVLGLKPGRSTVLAQHTSFQAAVEVQVGQP